MLYPYRFEPILVERVWGGDTLARFGKMVSPGQRIGESWEISDRNDAQSIVINGPLKGNTLRQLLERFGSKTLVGTLAPHTAPFPLLIKFLDARQRLSLQVHPPAAVAERLQGEPKTEMWYVLDADDGARLMVGLRRGVRAEDMIRELERDHPSLESYLHTFPVFRGDAVFVPSGRLHALDAGSVLIEVQQNSDTTYRVFDWNRAGLDGKPRGLHISQSLASIDFHDFEPGKVCVAMEEREGNAVQRLVECEHFCAHKLTIRSPWPQRCNGSSFHVLASVEGATILRTSGGREELLRVGEVTLLPAALGPYTLAPQAENAALLKVFLPVTSPVATIP